jgi:sugar phosphate isomerase/epimerase
MKLSISNIAWSQENDLQVYDMMKNLKFSGLEIAPTRIFPQQPYEQLSKASEWVEQLKKQYSFSISSMQSIWYGRQEKLFGTNEERHMLLVYTKKAIDFAVAIHCHNLVFGCPRNRNVPDGIETDLAHSFFKEVGDYAAAHNTVIGMEANPPIYNTNYINDTKAALQLIESVDSAGFKLNLDVGTMICNEESVDLLEGYGKYINHVHISEPGLKPIKKRTFHQTLRDRLTTENYQGYISIEMGKTDDLKLMEDTMCYVKKMFGCDE